MRHLALRLQRLWAATQNVQLPYTCGPSYRCNQRQASRQRHSVRSFSTAASARQLSRAIGAARRKPHRKQTHRFIAARHLVNVGGETRAMCGRRQALSTGRRRANAGIWASGHYHSGGGGGWCPRRRRFGSRRAEPGRGAPHHRFGSTCDEPGPGA